VPPQGDLVLVLVLFLGGVIVNDFGHRFSFLFFKGETLDVGDFSGESGLTETTFLSITYNTIHHQPTISFKKVKDKKRHTQNEPFVSYNIRKCFLYPHDAVLDSRVCRTIKS